MLVCPARDHGPLRRAFPIGARTSSFGRRDLRPNWLRGAPNVPCAWPAVIPRNPRRRNYAVCVASLFPGFNTVGTARHLGVETECGSEFGVGTHSLTEALAPLGSTRDLLFPPQEAIAAGERPKSDCFAALGKPLATRRQVFATLICRKS